LAQVVALKRTSTQAAGPIHGGLKAGQEIRLWALTGQLLGLHPKPGTACGPYELGIGQQNHGLRGVELAPQELAMDLAHQVVPDYFSGMFFFYFSHRSVSFIEGAWFLSQFPHFTVTDHSLRK
jgi:hypothetical protein